MDHVRILPIRLNIGYAGIISLEYTASMDPLTQSILRPHCISIGKIAFTTASTSGEGPVRKFKEKTGGFSCATRIAARESHAAVSCLCAARHTNSSSGPAGSEMRVVSEGRHVMDLKRSLKAYEEFDFILFGVGV